MLIKKDSLPERPIEGIENRVAYAVSLAREHKAIWFFARRVVSLLVASGSVRFGRLPPAPPVNV